MAFLFRDNGLGLFIKPRKDWEHYLLISENLNFLIDMLGK